MNEEFAEVYEVKDESSDSDIHFEGFRRNIKQSKAHKSMQMQLRGTSSAPISIDDDPIPGPGPSTQAATRRKRTRAALRLPPSEVINVDDSSEEEPTPKRLNQQIICLSSSPHLNLDPLPNIDQLEASNDQGSNTDCSVSSYKSYTAHAGFDLDNPKNWHPSNTSGCQASHLQSYDAAIVDQMKDLVLSVPSWTYTLPRSDFNFFSTSYKNLSEDFYPWQKLQLNAFHHIHKYQSMKFGSFKSLQDLELVATDRNAPWAINHIAQSDGMIAIASSVIDGADEEMSASPNHKDGSLVLWYQGHGRILSGHNKPGGCNTAQKFYTVNDVKFDPAFPTTLYSSGYDKTVQIWDLQHLEDMTVPKLSRTIDYNCIPSSISFRPGQSSGSLLAVAGSDGCVYLQSQTIIQTKLVIAYNRNHLTTGILWGPTHMNHLLFASSQERQGVAGIHRMFDVNQEASVLQFDADEGGEDLACDDSGQQLAIAVEGPDKSYSLRLYDIQHHNKHVIHTIPLEPFAAIPGKQPDETWDINCVTFSPDNLYIAVARGDNTLHVYDTRQLGHGPIQIFQHDREVSVTETYGVVQAQWAEGQQSRGIITAGADGCVRIWDVGKAATDPGNGQVVVQCDYDVGCFSTGDVDRGEWPLVVGENSGGVSIFSGPDRYYQNSTPATTT